MDEVDARKAVDGMLKEGERLNAKKDYKGMAAMYSEDCTIYSPFKNEPIRGRKGAEEELAKWHIANFDMKEEAFFYDGGNTASQVGNLVCYDDKKETIFKGKYQTVYKRIGKQWFIHYDMCNSDEHDIRGELTERHNRLGELLIAGEFDTLVDEFYADDFIAVAHGYPMMKGKEIMKMVYKALGFKRIARVERKEGQLAIISKDMVIECGSRHILYDKTGAVVQDMAGMVTYRRENGKFMFVVDLIIPITP